MLVSDPVSGTFDFCGVSGGIVFSIVSASLLAKAHFLFGGASGAAFLVSEPFDKVSLVYVV
jgi:hypothetical protein